MLCPKRMKYCDGMPEPSVPDDQNEETEVMHDPTNTEECPIEEEVFVRASPRDSQPEFHLQTDEHIPFGEYEPSIPSLNTNVPPLVLAGSLGQPGQLATAVHQPPCCHSVIAQPCQTTRQACGSVRQHPRDSGGSEQLQSSATGASSSTNSIDETNLSKTNIYVRGLPKEFTDQDLARLCQSVGRIRSLKAIMDKDTNRCKGYGFVDFESAESAATALRKINQHTNYHAQMAKQQEQDPTNLYFANLSGDVSEITLEGVLADYGNVISARILRDNNSRSKGVGFARMESKEICNQVINAFNGKQDDRLGEREILVKFADGSKKPKHQHMSTNYFQLGGHGSHGGQLHHHRLSGLGQAADLFHHHHQNGSGAFFHQNSLQAGAAELLSSTLTAAAIAATATSGAGGPAYVQASPLHAGYPHSLLHHHQQSFDNAGFLRNTALAALNCPGPALQSFGPYNAATAMAVAASNPPPLFVINPPHLGCHVDTSQFAEMPAHLDETSAPGTSRIQQVLATGACSGECCANDLSQYLEGGNQRAAMAPLSSPSGGAYVLTPSAQQQHLAAALAQMQICRNGQQPLAAPTSNPSPSGFTPGPPSHQHSQFGAPLGSQNLAQACAAAAVYQQLAAGQAASAGLYHQHNPSLQQLISAVTAGYGTNNPTFMTTHPAHQLGVNCNGAITPSGYISMSPNGGPSAFILSYLPPNPAAALEESIHNRAGLLANLYGHQFNGYGPASSSGFVPQYPGHHQALMGAANNCCGAAAAYYQQPPVNIVGGPHQHCQNAIPSDDSIPDEHQVIAGSRSSCSTIVPGTCPSCREIVITGADMVGSSGEPVMNGGVDMDDEPDDVVLAPPPQRTPMGEMEHPTAVLAATAARVDRRRGDTSEACSGRADIPLSGEQGLVQNGPSSSEQDVGRRSEIGVKGDSSASFAGQGDCVYSRPLGTPDDGQTSNNLTSTDHT